MDFERDPNDEQKAKLDEASGTYISLDPITTIEKYFFYLPQLVQLGGADSNDEYTRLHSAGRRYTMLPVDEDNFIIDANARTIAVPSSFAKNGVGVQGDELCEVLYFEIDRYFDAMDLDTADIYIEWTRVDGQSGVSKPWVIDIESHPNKIIFGWALSSSITKEIGNLKFAVRFFQWADNEHTKLQYSWATQAQTVTIKSTLNFTLGSDDYMAELDTDNTIIARIQNSETYVTDNEEANVPIYIFNLDNNLVTRELAGGGTVTEEAGIQADGKVYIDLVMDNENNESYTFKVQARSTDGGIISYNWRKVGQGQYVGTEAYNTAEDTQSSIGIIFELTEDETADENKIYYERTTVNGVDAYRAYTRTLDGVNPNSEGLYERFATCTIKKIGEYYAIATNRKTGKNLKTQDSYTCVVPMPVEPTIVTQIPTYQIIPEVDGEINQVTLTVEAANTETNGSNKGTLSYTWWYKEDETDEVYQQIMLDEPTATLELVDGTTLPGITYKDERPATLEGFYMVKINNHKNMEDTSIDSIGCHVSYKAKAPVLSFPTGLKPSEDAPADTQIQFGYAVHVVVDSEWAAVHNNTEGFTYQWYKSEDLVNDPATDVLIEGATADTYTPTVSGNYYCVVTNHKNETTAETVSRVFSVA